MLLSTNEHSSAPVYLCCRGRGRLELIHGPRPIRVLFRWNALAGGCRAPGRPPCDSRLLGVRCMKCRCTVWEVRAVCEALLVDIFESALALDNLGAISDRTRRKRVLCVDGVPRCRQAVEVAVFDASERYFLSYGWCW